MQSEAELSASLDSSTEVPGEAAVFGQPCKLTVDVQLLSDIHTDANFTEDFQFPLS